MFFRYFIFIKIFFLVLLANNLQAKEYSVGKTFENLFHIDFVSGKHTIPLPPGVWHLAHKFEALSDGPDNPNRISTHLLTRITEGRVTGLASIRMGKDTPTNGWEPDGACENKKWRDKAHLIQGHGGEYDDEEDCLIVKWRWRFKSHRKNFVPIVRYLSSKKFEWADMPYSWVSLYFFYTGEGDFLNYYMYLPPEQYGFKQEEEYDQYDPIIPWMPNNINQHPKKKKFMESAISWAKSWKKLVKKGFVDNQLSLQEVLNHPKIDGSMAIAAPAKKVSSPKVTAPAGDIENKLKKLKKLYDAELISEEEYKEKKKAILEAM